MRNQDKRVDSVSDLGEGRVRTGIDASSPSTRDRGKCGDDHRCIESGYKVEGENVETLRAVLTWGSGFVLGIAVALSTLGL